MKRKRGELIPDIHDPGSIQLQGVNSVIDRRGWSPKSRLDNFSSADSESDSDCDSLFDASGDDSASESQGTSLNSQPTQHERHPAQRTAPPIPGLHLNTTAMIPVDIAEQLWIDSMKTFFTDGNVNQVMLFERARKPKPMILNLSSGNTAGESCVDTFKNSLPSFLLNLLEILKGLLKDAIPSAVYDLLFPLDDESGQARQVILNHYKPGEGITPHVDLLKRYGDGIIGVSLHSGTVMDFSNVIPGPGEQIYNPAVTADDPAPEQDMIIPSLSNLPGLEPRRHSVYLPERSIIVLSGDSRYKWTHGIMKRTEDEVNSLDGNTTERLPRGERLSITFRWLLPGADIVGA